MILSTWRKLWAKPVFRAIFCPVAFVLFILGAIIASTYTPQPVTDALNGVAEWGLLLVAIPVGIFWLTFVTFITPWKKNAAGRAVTILGFGLVVLLGVNAASIFLGLEYLGREYIRIVSYYGLSAALIYLTYVAVHLNVTDAIARLKAKAITDAVRTSKQDSEAADS